MSRGGRIRFGKTENGAHRGLAEVSVQNVVLGQLIERRGYGYELADRLRA